MTAIEKFVAKIITDPLSWVSTYFDLFAFYFGVFLPSLPYTIFIIAVVGFFVAVLQSIAAIMLWAVMHMTPDRTFIGSQSQGYLLTLSLFVRPPLLIIGLFAAFLLINPILAYSSKAFWAMRAAEVQHSNWLAQFAQWKNWVIVYGMMLLPIVYMIFGLSAGMADEVLKWIGNGVSPLGQTQAMSQMQSRSETYGQNKAEEAGGRGGKGRVTRALDDAASGNGNQGGGKHGGYNPATGGQVQLAPTTPSRNDG